MVNNDMNESAGISPASAAGTAPPGTRAFLPLFPGWMRGEMAVIVIVMIALIARLTGRLDRFRDRTAQAGGSR
jgi:hypothetical protein